MQIKNIIKLLYNRLKRLVEILNLLFNQVSTEATFYVVSPFYNSNIDTIKCIESVYNQNYPRNKIKHILIDDVSTDNSGELVKEWITKHPNNTIEFIQNEVNQGLCANNHFAFLKAPKNSIIVMLDGDDWLSDNNIFMYLAKIYSNNNIWATYNSWISSTGGVIGSTRKVPKRTIKENSFRSSPWVTSHLKTFRGGLYKHIPKQYLIDPKSNTWWEKSSDRAFFFSILELAGKHIYHCQKLCYIYNIREHTKKNKHISVQEDCSKRISLLTPLSPISKI